MTNLNKLKALALAVDENSNKKRWSPTNKILVKKGDKYGHLTIIKEVFNQNKGYKRFFLVKCVCGKEKISELNYLRTKNKTKSCGCLKAAVIRSLMQKHGAYSKETRSPLISVYQNMIYRCHSPNCKQYKNYGKRGIHVCKEWRESIGNFIKDMGPRPTEKHTLDRIDNNKGYYPANCKWSDRREQSINRRVTIEIRYKRLTLSLLEWSEILNVPRFLIYSRLKNFKGKPSSVILFSPNRYSGRRNPMTEKYFLDNFYHDLLQGKRAREVLKKFGGSDD
jgi:hypothetical protein